MRLPGHGGGNLAGDEGGRGIIGGHVGDGDVIFGHAFLFQEHVEPEFGDRTLVQGDGLAFQILERLDVRLRDDAVAAVAVVDRQHIFEAELVRAVFHQLVDGGGGAVEVAAGDCRHVKC